MNITYLIPSGKFPTCIRDIGDWYENISNIKNKVDIYHSNREFWKILFSYDLISILHKFLNNADEESLLKSIDNSSEVLEKFKDKNVYKNLESYSEYVLKAIKHLNVLNSIQEECRFYFPQGAQIKNLNYKSSYELVKFSTKESLIYNLIKESLSNIKQKIDVLLIQVSSHQELLNSMIAVNILKKANKDIYVCLVDHSFENFSLLSNIEELKKNKNLFKIFDSIIEYKSEKDFVIKALIEDIDKGNRKRGFLNINQFRCEEKEKSKNRVMPLINIFAPSNILSMRLGNNKCYWSKCNFCVQNIKYKYEKNNDISIEEIVDRISKFIKVGYEYFSFSNEALSPQFLKQFSFQIIKKNLKFRWACRCRVDKLITSDLLNMMKQAGCYEIMFGIESISKQVLKSMNKYSIMPTNNDIKRILLDTHNSRIIPHVTLIVGYPTEEPEDSIKTVMFMEKLVEVIPELIIIINKFTVFPKSVIAKNPEKFHIVLEDYYGDVPYSINFKYKEGQYSEEGYVDSLIKKFNEGIFQKTYWSKYRNNYIVKKVKSLYSVSGHGVILKNEM